MKNINRQLILNQIRTDKRISRAALANRLQISATTVAAIVDELITEGLVEECGRSASNGGRKALLLRLNPEARYAVGLDFYDDELTGVLANMQGDVAAQESVALDETVDQEVLIAEMARLVQRLLGDIDRDRVLGVGVSVPGAVNSRAGRVIFSSKLKWEDVEIVSRLQERLGLEVSIENNVKAAALAEFWLNGEHDANNLVYLSIGNGIGSCLILGGRIYHGEHGAAGEIGHVPLVCEGPQCNCGNRGCFETVASRRALVRMIKERMPLDERRKAGIFADPEKPAAAEVFEAYRRHYPAAIEVVEAVAENVARGIMQVINFLNPGVIVLGGRLMEEGGPEFLDLVLLKVKSCAAGLPLIRGLLKEIRITGARMGRIASARGASALVLRRFYKIPIM